jgi:hypothetical protein
MSTTTTGHNVASVVKITSSTTVALVLSGTEERLTSTVTAEVTDNFGNIQADVPLTFTSSDLSVADVDLETGVVTAVGPGQAIIECSAPFGNNSISTVNADGTPLNKIYSSVLFSVTEYGNGLPILPDFEFSIDSPTYTVSSNGTFTITITQTALNGFTGSVQYTLRTSRPIYPGQSGYGVGQPLPTVSFMFYTPYGGIPVTVAGNTSGTITGGSGTLTLNFTAQDAPAGTVPFVISGLYPTWGTTGAAAGGPIRAHNASATLTVTA